MENITPALNQVKSGKKDGYCVLSTNHLKNGYNRFYVLLCMFLNSMIHGCSPDVWFVFDIL